MKKNNAHGHLITKDQVPDEFFKTKANILSESLIVSAPFEWTSKIGCLFTKSKRLPEMIDLYQMHLLDQAGAYIKEMDEAGIEKSIILMMNLNGSSFGDFSEWSYPYQIEVMAEVKRKYPGRIYVFTFFDPRIEDSHLEVEKAFTRYDFDGIKMYPALGYDPWHKSVHNTSSVNYRLEYVYDLLDAFAKSNQPKPISSHCSKGGAYSDRTMRSKEERNWLSNPLRWVEVAESYSDVKICLSHFGGDLHDFNYNDSSLDKKDELASLITDMMFNLPNIWTDTAYNDKLLDKDTAYNWATNFWNLPDHVYSRMMFGTDWLMTRHRWTEKEYSDLFEKNLTKHVPTYRYQVCNQILEDVFYRNFFEFLGVKEI